MVVSWVERRAARAARWEIDLSGGTSIVPWRARTGSMRALVVMGLEDLDLLDGEIPVVPFGEVAEYDGADTDAAEGD